MRALAKGEQRAEPEGHLCHLAAGAGVRQSCGSDFAVYNTGGGSRLTLNAVLEIVGRVSGRRPLITSDSAHRAICGMYADTSLARTDSGFHPTVRIEECLCADHKRLANNL